MHEVTDEVGRTLRIPVNPTRLISLAPSLTETVYALGAQDRLVGDTVYCDYPPDAQKKPKVGGVTDPNLEEIAALHPDLVLVTKDGNRLETVRALESFGIPAYASNPRKVAEILTSTEKLAAVLNVPEAGKALADEMQHRLDALKAKLNGVSPKSVLFVVWTEPLISVGKDTFIADAIGRAGAVSIVDSTQDWPQVSMEEVAHLQPDYLVFAHSGSDVVDHGFESLANLPGWRILNAVRARHYAVISDAVIRPAPRIISAIEDLAKQLHPEVFAEPPAKEKTPPSPNSASLVDRSPSPASNCSFVSIQSVEFSCAR
jgi:iron complex transport system substrate-binding protein